MRKEPVKKNYKECWGVKNKTTRIPERLKDRKIERRCDNNNILITEENIYAKLLKKKM